MRVATSILLDRACCSGDNELHAKSSTTCMFLTVSELKSLASAAMNVPKKELLTLPEAPSPVCPVPDLRAAQIVGPIRPLVHAIFLETLDAQRRLSRMHYEEFDPTDYSVVVKLRGNPPKAWKWEIYRACRCCPLESSPIFFESAALAAKEGKKALARLLANGKHAA